MKTLRVLFLASLTVLAACASAPPAAPPAPKGPDLNGTWVLTVESQMGAQDAEMTLQQNGKQIAGTLTGPAGSVPYTGTVDGTAVNFSFTINVDGTDLQIDQVGTLEGDNAMKGKSIFGSFGEGSFTARKK